MILPKLPEWLSILELANNILSSAILILSFSLFVYILTYNLHSHVGRSFAALLLAVIIVYAGDVILPQVEWQEAWLRFQWIGIVLVPAAYLHFSRSVLLATWLQPERSTWGWLVRGAYILSAFFGILALATDLVVKAPVGVVPLINLQPGILFPVFTFYFIVATMWGAWNLLRARVRARSMASRRRLNYLLWSFAAPALGVFPYLIVISWAVDTSTMTVLVFSIIANIAIGIMLVVMTYSVAYFGVLSPDRVVKRQLVYFLLRGPILAVIIVGLILTVPEVEAILGLPPDTALTLFIVGVIVLAPVILYLLQPRIDRILYRSETDEVQWLRTLETRLMTSGDLRQFLENVLLSICDAFQVSEGFVALPGDTGARLEAVVGSEKNARRALALPDVQKLLTADVADQDLYRVDGYYVRRLVNRHTDQPLGIVAICSSEARPTEVDEQTDVVIQHLLRRAEIAVEDRRLQLDVYEALRPILPEIEVIQALGGTVPYVIPSPSSAATSSTLAASPEFIEWVREALSHYWGGPKLSSSPLLSLTVVRQALSAYDNSPTRALRAVLQDAIERQRPPGDRQMLASEWLLYNILEMKFVQGKRVRDIANRLAMSESDLYRKQRFAISEVARTLAEMEASVSSNGATAESDPIILSTPF